MLPVFIAVNFECSLLLMLYVVGNMLLLMMGQNWNLLHEYFQSMPRLTLKLMLYAVDVMSVM